MKFFLSSFCCFIVDVIAPLGVFLLLDSLGRRLAVNLSFLEAQW
jgi:hypothetical protein